MIQHYECERENRIYRPVTLQAFLVMCGHDVLFYIKIMASHYKRCPEEFQKVRKHMAYTFLRKQPTLYNIIVC